eukprot:TRINITY_DN6420_c0_g1_i1.p1 TRINITY_DN6420_c0_g1~~TRINITY_DN6420_c0_g1_i1.p1  ORF type:complete len:186 (+),score=61.73 TRINITY_DN6420_c0_g1_i1:316-873(+)
MPRKQRRARGRAREQKGGGAAEVVVCVASDEGAAAGAEQYGIDTDVMRCFTGMPPHAACPLSNAAVEENDFEVVDWKAGENWLVASFAQTDQTALSSDEQTFLDAHVDDFLCPETDSLDDFDAHSFEDVSQVLPEAVFRKRNLDDASDSESEESEGDSDVDEEDAECHRYDESLNLHLDRLMASP